MKRDDFVFTIGFHGNVAIVDGKAKRKYGKLGTMELAERGLYRSAFASALYAGSEFELEQFMEYYRAQTGSEITGVESFKRLFGVDEAREVSKTIAV